MYGGDGLPLDMVESSTYGIHPPSGFSDTRQPSEAECDLHREGGGASAGEEGVPTKGSERETHSPEGGKLQHQRSRSSVKKEQVDVVQ